MSTAGIAWIAAGECDGRSGPRPAPGANTTTSAPAPAGQVSAPGGVRSDGMPAGRWGAPSTLGLPLDDRGLLLADGLFETVLLEGGRPQLLAPHLQRWRRSAALLGLAPPPSEGAVRALLAEAMARSGIGTGALRLNWSRGGGSRGLDPPEPGGERFWLQLSPWSPQFTPVSAIVSPTERRCASSLLSRCKTFAYGSAIQARRQAHAAGAEEALLESTAGGLCCAAAANLLLHDGERWLTPPLTSGCLAGVMRQRALDQGVAREALQPIAPEALQGGGIDRALLINSLGCRPLRRCDGRPLNPPSPAEAEALWRALLDPSD